jgi:hypothetical protein
MNKKLRSFLLNLLALMGLGSFLLVFYNGFQMLRIFVEGVYFKILDSAILSPTLSII